LFTHVYAPPSLPCVHANLLTLASLVQAERIAAKLLQPSKKRRRRKKKQQNNSDSDESRKSSDSSSSSSSGYSSDSSVEYVPGFIDDPAIVHGRHRQTLMGDRALGPILSSTIQFVRPQALKSELNKQVRRASVKAVLRPPAAHDLLRSSPFTPELAPASTISPELRFSCLICACCISLSRFIRP